MNCQSLFSWKSKKVVSLSSAEFTYRVVKVSKMAFSIVVDYIFILKKTRLYILLELSVHST